MVHDGFGRGDRFLRASDAIDGMVAPYGLRHAVFLAHAPAATRQDTVLFTRPAE